MSDDRWHASLIDSRASRSDRSSLLPTTDRLPSLHSLHSLHSLLSSSTLDGRSSTSSTTAARYSSIASSSALVHARGLSLVWKAVDASPTAFRQGAILSIWYDVALEDVVANKHLPPLSLQDFEDYLKYVEGSSQNLHFYLWLERYESLHKDWASAVLPTVPSTSTGGYRPRDLWERLNPCQDRTLKEAYAYAKARWFDYGAPTRLDVPDEIRRAVLDIPNLPPPPETSVNELTHRLPSFPNQPSPSHFDKLLDHVRLRLRSAFTRFLRLAFTNGGLWHACAGHIGSMVLFLAPGLAMWTLGVSAGGRRGLVVGSLPLLWIGFSLALMTLNKHCFSVYATGDARQLYPHEIIRPIPSEHSSPPAVYSLDVPPQPDDSPTTPSPYEPRLGRKASGILSIMSGVTGGARMGKRGSGSTGGGILGMFHRRGEDEAEGEDGEGGMAIELDTRRTMERTREMDLKLPLPPARKTKDLPRLSLGADTLPIHASAPPPAPSNNNNIYPDPNYDHQHTVTSVSDIADLRIFTEEEDFGIVVSDAYEEDEEYAFGPHPIQRISRIQIDTHDEIKGEGGAPGSSGLESIQVQVEPPTPSSGPEHTSLQVPTSAPSRRSALPDIFSFHTPRSPSPSPSSPSPTTPQPKLLKSSVSPALEWVLTQARPTSSGSKQQPDVESGSSRDDIVLMSPHWRTMFGPMTLVHDPLVRRAHWAVTVRCALVGAIIVCGMALGLIR